MSGQSPQNMMPQKTAIGSATYSNGATNAASTLEYALVEANARLRTIIAVTMKKKLLLQIWCLPILGAGMHTHRFREPLGAMANIAITPTITNQEINKVHHNNHAENIGFISQISREKLIGRITTG